MTRFIAAVVLWCGLVMSALAGTAEPVAQDPVLEKRLNALSAELRCLVCQNQSLADSHAELAIDLKNQVRDMMRAGKTDDEIKQYLTQRYGDFVLYNPPVKASTWLLWVGPFVLLVGGVFVLSFILRSRRRDMAVAKQASPADTADRERARALLAGDGAARE
jgi:cytochrome c-type biogenesis protein CcmH